MTDIVVVKMGGATLGSHDTIIEDLVHLQREGWKLVVVHGGGRELTQWLNKLGITTKFVEGERATDEASLEVATAILAGLVNKEIVAQLNIFGGRAVGLSGVDGSLISGRPKSKQSGYTGEVEKVDAELLLVLLEAGYMPVISPISFYPSKSSPRPLLNINGDPVAGEIAAAISARKLIFLTDVAGIVDEKGALIPSLSSSRAEVLLSSGVISGGMIPKVKASLKALHSIASAHIIDGREPHALARELEEGGYGTVIEEAK